MTYQFLDPQDAGLTLRSQPCQWFAISLGAAGQNMLSRTKEPQRFVKPDPPHHFLLATRQVALYANGTKQLWEFCKLHPPMLRLLC